MVIRNKHWKSIYKPSDKTWDYFATNLNFWNVYSWKSSQHASTHDLAHKWKFG